MKKLLTFLCLISAFAVPAQDSQTDLSVVHPSSLALEHLLNLFTIHGVPKNRNQDDTVAILINHGYCIGFSHKHRQPLWAAYQVSRPKQDVDYERFPFFVDDRRLPAGSQIGNGTFGQGYDRGHLAPNAAINHQFGKLAQMETFLMSNICPQKGNLNQGVWQRLEAAILKNYFGRKDDSAHIWVLAGPVFGESPQLLTRSNGTTVSIPEAFYCILARPRSYPYDHPTRSEYVAFLFDQALPKNTPLNASFIVSINEIERLTGLNFFPVLTNTQEQRIEDAIAEDVW